MHWIDPDSLPEVSGMVARFLVNPHGIPDGFLLEDGQEVHFPPHMAPEIEAALAAAPKTQVRIRGVRPRAAPVLAAVAIAIGERRIEDQGPPEHHHKPHKPGHREKETEQGVVSRWLHGPKGERRGFLLESGTLVRFPKHAAEEAEAVVTLGGEIAVRGKALDTSYGRVIDAHAMGPTVKELRDLDDDKPKKPKPHHRHGPHAGRHA